ncbi:MAG: hypothetical protein ACRC0S_01980 [Fusobacteriaceae bacterium]
MRTEELIFTNAGLNLLKKALAQEKKVDFTTMKIGTGNKSTIIEYEGLTDLVSFYMDIGLSSLKMTDTGLVKATSYFTNKDFVSEVVITEVGLFGKLENEEEILICYVNDGYGESFPPGDTGNILQKQRSFEFGIDRNTKVTAVVSSTMFATIVDLEEKEQAFTKNTGFNKNLGTEVDTVLEGAKLAEILGVEYSGILNNTTQKVLGKSYYDNANKKIFKCIKNTNINYADAQFFEAISNNDLLGKLQNLYTRKIIPITAVPGIIQTTGSYISDKLLIVKIGAPGVEGSQFEIGNAILDFKISCESTYTLIPYATANGISGGNIGFGLSSVGVVTIDNIFNIDGKSITQTGIAPSFHGTLITRIN